MVPFRFAVGGHIFHHPGRKRPKNDAVNKFAKNKANSLFDDVTSEVTNPGALARAARVPEGSGTDVGLMS